MVAVNRFKNETAREPNRLKVIRPDAYVEVARPGGVPILGTLRHTVLSCVGYRVTYVVMWWTDETPYCAEFESFEVAPISQHDWMEIVL